MTFESPLNHLLGRRAFLTRSTTSLGMIALSSLLSPRLFAADPGPSLKTGGALGSLHFPPRAKRIIYLFMSGAPSHIDLYDPKPKLKDLTGSELPPSVRMGQRITGMTSGQKELQVVGSPFEFHKCGKAGTEISELLPNIGKVVDMKPEPGTMVAPNSNIVLYIGVASSTPTTTPTPTTQTTTTTIGP